MQADAATRVIGAVCGARAGTLGEEERRMEIGVHKVAMSAPSDVSELDRLIEAGTVDPRAIVCSDRQDGGQRRRQRFHARLRDPVLSIAARPSPRRARRRRSARRVAFVWSGGCEGVLSPHATVSSRRHPGDAAGTPGGRLALGIEVTRDIAAGGGRHHGRGRGSRRRRAALPRRSGHHGSGRCSLRPGQGTAAHARQHRRRRPARRRAW